VRFNERQRALLERVATEATVWNVTAQHDRRGARIVVAWSDGVHDYRETVATYAGHATDEAVLAKTTAAARTIAAVRNGATI